MKIHNARKSARHGQTLKPRVECLEDRRLMAFDLVQAAAMAVGQPFPEGPASEIAPYVGNAVAGMTGPSLAGSKLGSGTDGEVVVAGGLSGGVVGSALGRGQGEEIPSIQGGLSGGVVGSAVDRAMQDVSLLGGKGGIGGDVSC